MFILNGIFFRVKVPFNTTYSVSIANLSSKSASLTINSGEARVVSPAHGLWGQLMDHILWSTLLRIWSKQHNNIVTDPACTPCGKVDTTRSNELKIAIASRRHSRSALYVHNQYNNLVQVSVFLSQQPVVFSLWKLYMHAHKIKQDCLLHVIWSKTTRKCICI